MQTFRSLFPVVQRSGRGRREPMPSNLVAVTKGAKKLLLSCRGTTALEGPASRLPMWARIYLAIKNHSQVITVKKLCQVRSVRYATIEPIGVGQDLPTQQNVKRLFRATGVITLGMTSRAGGVDFKVVHMMPMDRTCNGGRVNKATEYIIKKSDDGEDSAFYSN